MRKNTAIMLLLMFVLAVPRAGNLWAQAEKKAPPPPEPTVKVGDMAPDFTLRDQTGKQVKLSDFRGKKSVALAFYVFAFTGG
jgi:cytochrome oxidase Cu insertion factor (SCO1/SenC/PrrC family)